MSSMVLDLQKHILESDRSISDLLYMALAIARKLSLEEFTKWIEQELNGYADVRKVPSYRDVSGVPVALSSLGQWEKMLVYNLEPEMLQQISTFHIHYPISEIENIVNQNVSAYVITYDEQAQQMLMNAMNMHTIPGVKIDSNKLKTILNAVKKILLEWTLDLEKKDILGENMVFSDKEKQIAITSVVTISQLM